MIKNIFSRALLICIGLTWFAVHDAMAQQESAAQELQVVSFTEADKSDFDTTTPSNFAGALKTTALVKVFMPGEIESTDPKSSKDIERKMTSNGYANYVWVEQHANSIRIVPKGNKFQTKLVKFKEYGVPVYSVKNKKGGLQAGKVYRLVLRDPSPVEIITWLPNAYATIDGSGHFSGDENGHIMLNDFPLGEHTVSIYAKDGSSRGTVVVNDENRGKAIEHDARKKTRISIRTNPEGAPIQIQDGEYISKFDPSREYAHKSYKVIATFGNNVVKDEISVDDKHTSFVINNTKTYDITPMFGSAVSATVYENGKALVAGEESDVVLDGYTYHVTRPIGSKYKYYAAGSNGKSKTRTVVVGNSMDTEYKLNIAARNSFVWPWQREYDAAPMGVAIGYVQKQMVTKGEGEKVKENGVWNDGEDKWLHGMQVGVFGQPCFSWGLGLYTGLFYEAYLSSNGSGNSDEYEDFQEHNIVVPVHALYRLPFGKTCALNVHGGLGLSYVVYGAYKADDYEDNSDFYGEDGSPKRFNMALEVGLDFRVGPVQVGFLYSKGLTDHGVYSSYGDYKTTYNKIGINVAWVVGN